MRLPIPLAGLLAIAGISGCSPGSPATRAEFVYVGTFQVQAYDGAPKGILARGTKGSPGEVWVAQHYGPIRRVTRYTPEGALLGTLHILPDSTGANLRTLAAGEDGATWLLQQYALNSGSIVSVDRAGTAIKSVPLESGYTPVGIASAAGLLYVSELASAATGGPLKCHVKVFDQTGALVRVFGNTGPNPLSRPEGVVAKDSSIWVCDADRMRLYRPDGRLIRSFGSGTAPGFNHWDPRSVALTSDNHLLVCDAANRVVDEFQADGKFLGNFDGETVGGDLWFAPQFVATQPDGRGGDFVYVSTTSDLRPGHVDILSRRVVFSQSRPGVLQPATTH